MTGVVAVPVAYQGNAAGVPGGSSGQIDFSGEWRLVEGLSATDASNRSPIGDTGSILHDGQMLTLTSARGGVLRFNLDGSETRRVTVSPTGDPFTAASRVRWLSNALLITTAHTRPSLPNAWEEMLVLSFDGQRQLVVIVVTPNKWPYGTTTTYRVVYRRTS